MTDSLTSLACLRQFGAAAMTAVGSSSDQAEAFVESLIWADASGRKTHGFWRLPTYLKRLKLGLINSRPEPRVENDSASLLSIDGDNGLGQFVGDVAARHAADVAKAFGCAAVTVRNSNHFGAAGYFASRLAEDGLLALVVSNSMPRVAPSGGRRAVFGTNPIAFSAPLRDEQPVLFDFAVSAMAGSEVMRLAADGQSLQEGIAVDAQGEPLLDPKQVSSGSLLPFGGHKGYGIALMVEILAGVLSGAGISQGVGSMFNDFTRSSNTGHFFLVIDPLKIWNPIDDYYQRSAALVQLIADSGEKGQVRVPGQQTWTRLAEAKNSGVRLPADYVEALNGVAAEMRIEKLRVSPAV